jgi:two-component system, cell cycle sensor histidine kinase and response regulator CckA
VARGASRRRADAYDRYGLTVGALRHERSTVNQQATLRTVGEGLRVVGASEDHRSRIFVVEDEVIISEDIAQTLERLGYEIAGAAHTGMQALLEVERTKPDLVLMDIKLGGRLDGIQTTAAIRKRFSTPVIYLTSHSDEATLARAKETGPHGYLLKPFNERDLRTAIEVALRKHELETRLEQRERWYSTTLASVGDAVIATDPQERVTFMNPIAEELTGWKSEDAQGKPVHEVFKILSSTGAKLQAKVSEAIRGGFRAELAAGTKLLDRAGTSIDVDDSVAPIVDRAGGVLGSVVVFRDITERKRLEERVTLAERLASIATMAAGMAHELNNPLAATVGNVDFAVRRLNELMLALSPEDAARLMPGFQEISDALDDAQSAGRRVRNIVRDLKKFSRAEEVSKDIVDLPNSIDAALVVTHHLVKSSTSITKLFGTTPFVEVNEGQLVQVFANLLANALQAKSDERPHTIRISTHTDELGRAIVEVEDSGRGIEPGNLPRIFDPFFTTRPAGDGMGLGLSICQRIISEAGGELGVESQLGVGTTFRVTLPQAEDPSRKPKTTTLPPPSTRRARVLVIDDEEMVGRTIERLLARFHDVRLETDPRSALSRLASESFDVILCDMTMPAMNGMDVYRSIELVNPSLAKRVVFLTGGAVSLEVESFLNQCSSLVLNKPFGGPQLLAVVASFVV